jgi:hypothetical protein
MHTGTQLLQQIMDTILHGPVLCIDCRTKLIKGLHGLRRRLIFVHDDDFYEIGFNAERRLSAVPSPCLYLTDKSSQQALLDPRHRTTSVRRALATAPSESGNTNNTCAYQHMIHFSDVAMAYSPRRPEMHTPNLAFMTANFADKP